MNIDLVWDDAKCRGDWQVVGGRLSTGNLLRTAVLISLFTDRVAQPDYVAQDGDRRGWWMDTLDGIPIGSRLWQLRRRKIANRAVLAAEAKDMLREALAWLVSSGIAARVDVAVDVPPAGPGRSGTVLLFGVAVVQPGGTTTQVSALWSAV